MADEVVQSVRKVVTLGREQCTKFTEERLAHCTKSLTDTLTENSVPLLNTPPDRPLPKGKL